uniref:BppU family phage baseplate upper protein n=1 Tax=Clostridium perfringens TaxID=1502 RepID=UPI0024BC337E
MKKIFINVDSYNNEGIKTIQGNNNAETYKIYLLKNKIRLSLVNKTVKLGYVMAGTTKGDIIEDLNITNAEQGEITFPITNKISKKDGVYTCQIAIYGADGFLEYTATFGLTVQANIFTKIAGEIENSKDLTYIERILEEATNVSEELKSNIPVARQLNSDLENQNRILNENMDRANEVNKTLITTTEQSKVAATDAIEKKSQLESSIVKAKEFIDGLDGSQDIPSIRMELTKLQNGLKSNQALEYSGSSISANDTLEGRSEGMKVKGLTLQNLSIQEGYYINSNGTQQYFHFRKYKNLFKSGKYTLKNITGKALIWDISRKDNDEWVKSIKSNKSIVIELEEGQYVRNIQALTINGWILDESTRKLLEPNVVVLEGDKLNIIDNIPYFEGIKSFGEAEKEGDKYKIKLLSKNKNFFNKETDLSNWWGSHGELHKGDSSGKKYSILTKAFSGFKYIINVTTPYSFYTFLDNEFNVLGYGEGKNTQVAPVGTRKLLWYLDPGGIDKGLYNKIQVEPGTISTEYQSYQEDKKDILIKEPLRGFNENTCDVMYEDNGQVKINRQVSEYTFTGDEKITKWADSPNACWFTIRN